MEHNQLIRINLLYMVAGLMVAINPLMLNESGIIGQILRSGTINLTGTIALTMALIVVILFTFCMLFNIPIEFTLVILLPMILASLAVYNTGILMGLLIVFILFLAIIITKNFIFR